MATTKREKLFTEFPPVSTEQWEEVIKADLKGADYERKLVWKTPEGFNVRPYYRAENLAGLKFLGSEAGVFPYVRGTRAHNRWKIHQTVIVNCPKEANAVALKILNAGVDSIEFQIVPETFSAEDLNTLLKDIHIPAVEITFSGSKTAHVAELVIAKDRKGTTACGRGAHQFSASTAGQETDFERQLLFGERCQMFREDRRPGSENQNLQRYPRNHGIGRNLQQRRLDDRRGARLLARCRSRLPGTLMDMGFTIEEAAKKIRFSQAITSNYFMEIAKLRAGVCCGPTS